MSDSIGASPEPSLSQEDVPVTDDGDSDFESADDAPAFMNSNTIQALNHLYPDEDEDFFDGDYDVEEHDEDDDEEEDEDDVSDEEDHSEDFSDDEFPQGMRVCGCTVSLF